MTARPRYLPDATKPRVLVVAWAAIAAIALVLAIWFFVDGRPAFGVAWFVLAVGWCAVAFGAARVWGNGKP